MDLGCTGKNHVHALGLEIPNKERTRADHLGGKNTEEIRFIQGRADRANSSVWFVRSWFSNWRRQRERRGHSSCFGSQVFQQIKRHVITWCCKTWLRDLCAVAWEIWEKLCKLWAGRQRKKKRINLVAEDRALHKKNSVIWRDCRTTQVDQRVVRKGVPQLSTSISGCLKELGVKLRTKCGVPKRMLVIIDKAWKCRAYVMHRRSESP